ncbi:tricorn protease domain 2-containing protein, partial [Athelia psychrophila]
NVHDDIVQSVAFSPDGKHIASGSWDGAIYVWDAHTGKLIVGPFHAPGKVTSVAFSPDGKRIASTSLDGKTIHIFDM